MCIVQTQVGHFMQLGKNEVRLAYVLNLESLSAAMDCLEEALTVYPGRVSLDKKTVEAAK